MKLIKSLLAISVITAIAGCSPEKQDVVDETQARVVVSGAVIDPFISSAIVFADYNNDDVLDPFEPWAFTDNNGYYSLGKNGEDYCKEQSRYCLELPNNEPVKLVAVGGYDLTTLERMKSRMSKMYDGQGIQYITPLTSVGDMSLNEQNTIEQNQNFMTNAFSANESAFSLAFSIHKIVEMISEVIETEYPAIGDNEDFPVDVSGFVYGAINKLGKEEQVSLATFLTQLTDDQIDKILTKVRSELDALTIKKSNVQVDKNYAYHKAPQLMTANDLADRVRAFNSSFKSLHTLLTTQLSEDFTASKVRLLQILSSNAKQFSATKIQVVENILETYATDDEFLGKLSENSFDASYFENITSTSNVVSGNEKMEGREKLPNDLTTMQLVLTDKTTKRNAVIGFFFDGVIKGSITACVKFQNLRDANDAQNTNGTILTGNWNKDDYKIDLIVNLILLI